jgi:DNA-binding transcriptional MocR family regulator
MVDVRGIAAGLHVLGVFPRGYDEVRILAEARRRRIAVYGLSEHRVRSGEEAALLLGYAAIGDGTLRSAIRELRQAVAAASA